MKICRKAQSVKSEKNYYCVQTNCAPIRIYFVTDSVVRIRVAFDTENSGFTEASYSLLTTCWQDKLDAFFGERRHRIQVSPSSITEDTEDKTVIQGSRLTVVVEKNSFAIKIFDANGELLHSDVAELSYMEDANLRRIHTSEISPCDHFYGFGEKTGTLNKAECFMTMSPKDALGYNPEKTDSLYKHIPFYVRLNDSTGNATGYFYHNSAECDFDMGREHSNYWHYCSKYRCDSGDIDLFFIAGPKISDVIQSYTMLTGKSALLPKYALGYLGSSMYYSELDENCDKEIINFIDKAKTEKIPIDGFQLSSGYTSQSTCEGEKRCVFTWNEKRFPNPKSFFAEMSKRGITVSPNVKPGILLCHPKIKDFMQKDLFVKASSDEGGTKEVAVGSWWGGKGVFVDFTNENVRREWKNLLKENVLDYGTNSVWNDNCEYDSLVDKDALCAYEGAGGKIGRLKAVMANLMCYVARDAILEKDAKTRPFIVCRSGHSGIQTVAQTWSGDNRTSWNTLKYNIATILGMGLSGVSNYGCDIGGFYGHAPEAELLVRWVQNGIFQMRFSIHSVNSDNTVTEPWMYSEYTPIIRSAIQMRYRLFPYMYSLMYRAHETGLPAMEPLCLEFQSDKNVLDTSEEFLLGPFLFVANVLEKGATKRKFYLPTSSSGTLTKWYDFYTRQEYDGGKEYEIDVDISSIPLFVKEGSIIPLAQNQMFNLKTEFVTDLCLLCDCGVDSEFTLYEDDGITNNFEKGDFFKTVIKLRRDNADDKVEILFESEGLYQTKVKTIMLDVIAREKCPFFVKLNDTMLEKFINRTSWEKSTSGWYYSQTKKSVLIKYNAVANNYKVTILFKPFDMIGM